MENPSPQFYSTPPFFENSLSMPFIADNYFLELSSEVSEAMPFLLKAVKRELEPTQKPPSQLA
jgi:hypothetical protein